MRSSLHKAAVLSAIAIMIIGSGCSSRRESVKREFTAMGTLASIISLDDGDRTAIPSEEATQIAQKEFSRLEKTFTVYSLSSDVSRINRAAGQEWVDVSPDMVTLLAAARRYGELSGGAFDVTVGPIVRAWGFNSGVTPAAPLPPERIRQLLDTVGYGTIEVRPGAARLTRKDVMVDLGGIAKGYAVDIAWDLIQRKGGKNFIVNLGGNMRVSGQPSSKRPWTIGVRHPFSKEEIVGRMTLKDGMAVATSGNYERFVTIKGRKYAHIFDPRTGMPVEGMASVTVIGPSAVEVDALSTSCFVLGMDKAMDLLAKLPGNEAIFIPDSQPMTIWITPGMKDIFECFSQWTSTVKIISR